MRNLAIITARSGSKGVKDKNIRSLCGRPLMAYSIVSAIESGIFDEVFVSTDSGEYAEIARQCGADVPFLRSVRNSSDKADSWDAVRETLEEFAKVGKSFDNILLLQPTSPFRTSQDIKDSYAVLTVKEANAVLGLTEVEHSPLWCNTVGEDGCIDNFIDERYLGVPRQRLPKYYRINGAIYWIRKEELKKDSMFRENCYAYVMPNYRSIDIDTEMDFQLAEYMMACQKNAKGI